jgi:hypothetical protein
MINQQRTAADRFVAALARRDFGVMGACLAPGIRFRALVPPGPFEARGRTEVVARLERWFGGEDRFELLAASVDAIGTRLHLCWRVRMTTAGPPPESRLVEQHAFATAADRIEALDLVCSGFISECATSSPVRVLTKGEMT